ncbi:hypothetical protein BPO_1299 [Bergeyella porcorum]|uniref:Biotin and thiamin synthesis-associated domain-containing protein n=1 Tax=Bergeyella porcorum TaxID=1735111 RepID=A0AAU0F1K8_9FLAO
MFRRYYRNGRKDRRPLWNAENLSQYDPATRECSINALVAVEGTPLEDEKPVNIFEFVRMVATARIVLPKTQVRLSAGRTGLSPEGQALCFFAGANSIFAGDKLLTTPNPEVNEDRKLFEQLGIVPQAPFEKHAKREVVEKKIPNTNP